MKEKKKNTLSAGDGKIRIKKTYISRKHVHHLAWLRHPHFFSISGAVTLQLPNPVKLPVPHRCGLDDIRQKRAARWWSWPPTQKTALPPMHAVTVPPEASWLCCVNEKKKKSYFLLLQRDSTYCTVITSCIAPCIVGWLLRVRYNPGAWRLSSRRLLTLNPFFFQ